MDNEKFSAVYLPLLRQYWLPLTLGIMGLIFLGYGLIGYVYQNNKKGEILYEAASTSRGVEESPSTTSNVADAGLGKDITIDVEGAVEKPGVYKLSADSRMQDAVIAAGGLGKDADRERVAKSVNLAAKLTDGVKVYIPFAGDLAMGEGDSVLGDSITLININTAGEAELDSLAGVGKVTAEKIISNRPYGSIEELTQKKVMGAKVFEQIKEKISVN